jgi:hypothetical protein
VVADSVEDEAKLETPEYEERGDDPDGDEPVA